MDDADIMAMLLTMFKRPRGARWIWRALNIILDLNTRLYGAGATRELLRDLTGLRG